MSTDVKCDLNYSQKSRGPLFFPVHSQFIFVIPEMSKQTLKPQGGPTRNPSPQTVPRDVDETQNHFTMFGLPQLNPTSILPWEEIWNDVKWYISVDIFVIWTGWMDWIPWSDTVWFGLFHMQPDAMVFEALACWPCRRARGGDAVPTTWWHQNA